MSASDFSFCVECPTLRQIPNLLIVGERETADETVTLPRYGVKEQTTMPFTQFEAALAKTIAERSLTFAL